MTEYFAREIIKEGLGIETNLGYPLNIKILRQMEKRILERDFADIYFSGDREELEKLMDKVYGKGFFKNNIVQLETLQYTSKPEQLVKLANSFMQKIREPIIAKEDLITSYSEFK